MGPAVPRRSVPRLPRPVRLCLVGVHVVASVWWWGLLCLSLWTAPLASPVLPWVVATMGVASVVTGLVLGWCSPWWAASWVRWKVGLSLVVGALGAGVLCVGQGPAPALWWARCLGAGLLAIVVVLSVVKPSRRARSPRVSRRAVSRSALGSGRVVGSVRRAGRHRVV